MNDYENDHWFDGRGGLLRRVRNLRAYMKDAEIVTTLVDGGHATAAQVWLCLKAAEILDPPKRTRRKRG